MASGLRSTLVSNQSLTSRIMDRETKLKLLKSIGFAENKCEETLKNEAVSTKLAELIQHVNGVAFDCVHLDHDQLCLSDRRKTFSRPTNWTNNWASCCTTWEPSQNPKSKTI
jgi:hypothetical protein